MIRLLWGDPSSVLPLLFDGNEVVDTVQNSLAPVGELETEDFLQSRVVDVTLRDGDLFLPRFVEAALQLRARLGDVGNSVCGCKPFAAYEDALVPDLRCGRRVEGEHERAGDVAHVNRARVRLEWAVTAQEVVENIVGAERGETRLESSPFGRHGTQDERRVHCS